MSGITYSHGRMAWRELATSDTSKARAFYSELFGWKLSEFDMPTGKYLIAKVRDHTVAGMYSASSPQPSAWVAYVSVPDVDAATKTAVDNGGKVLMPPTSIPDVGRWSIIQDTDGAVIAPFKSGKGDGERPPMGPGCFCWETLMTKDGATAKSFYGKVFGWTTQPMPGTDVSLFSVDQTLQTQVADIQVSPRPSFWMSYVVVEKLEASRERATKLGGKVLQDLIDVPNVGRISVIADPSGAVLGLFQPQMRT